MAKQTTGVMVQEGETVARQRASLPGTNGRSIKQLSVVDVPKLPAMTPHMPIGEAVSFLPTTIEVFGQAVRSGSSKTLHRVTHLRRRLAILWASQG